MNIALIHFRVGETDGVSLEMDKWKNIFEKKGHNTFYIAGSEGTSRAIIIPELYYRDEYDLMLNDECFVELKNFTEDKLKEEIIARANKIEKQFINIFETNNIDLIVPNNLLCLGRSPYIAMALYNAIEKTNVKVINHHHDFYWERDFFQNQTTAFVQEILDKYFPPKDLNNVMKHVVINKPAQSDLKLKKGLDSAVVPNVFDFDANAWRKDEYNADLKEKLGLKENDIFFLQATRVTNRKAIELAIDLIATMNKSEFKSKMLQRTLYDGRKIKEDTEYVLVLVGLHEGGFGYEDKLVEHAKSLGVKMIVNPDLFDHSRHMDKNGEKIYSLWDAYVHCDMITYPSIYEGWGNQFLEGLFAKKPQIVFEYSIFKSDIKEKDFHIISLGDTYENSQNGLVHVSQEVLDAAADEVQDCLTNKERYYKNVEGNFKIGSEHFSLTSLDKMLSEILNEVESYIYD